MLIEIKVFPKSKKPGVKKAGNSLRVRLRSAPEKGKANKELIVALAEYYNVAKNKVKILKGEKSKNKVVEINSG